MADMPDPSAEQVQALGGAPATTAQRRTRLAQDANQKPVAKAPTDLWQRIRKGYKMAPLESGLVSDWENYYASRAEYFEQMIQNSRAFLYHVVTEVERRGMPSEIALLPMIESAYNPVAYSSAHASGIWQFIPSTGKNYGLKQNWWYDGRRDVIAATSAALDYLQTLYGMFNDWELALAAYNWGEGAVQRAVERNTANGAPADYRSLVNMPAETRNYVPKLIAVKNIITHPERFGLNLAPLPNVPHIEAVTVQRHIDVKLAAQFADMSLDEFKFLNPAHNTRVINSDTAETIVLPRAKVGTFLASMARNENKPLVSMKTHTVRAGERAESLAEQYGISVAELNSLNNIGPRRRIATGQTLMVPNRTDLQPSLDGIPLAVAQANPTRPVYRRVTVIVRGKRRTVTVAVAPTRSVAQRRASPIRKAAVSKPRVAGKSQVVRKRGSDKAGLQKVAYNPATKAKSHSQHR